MSKSPFLNYPEVFRADSTIRRVVENEMRNGRLRRIRSNVYTTNLIDPIESVIARNRWQIVGASLPGAVLTHRTALLSRPTERGTVFVSGPYDRLVDSLPGLRVRQIAGPGPLEGDQPFIGGSPARIVLWTSSRQRNSLRL